MISRERCVELLDKYVTTDWLKLHMRESEVIMRAVARRLGENEDEWGLTGLLHDLDYDYVGKDALRHAVDIDEIFEKEGLKVGEDITDGMYHAIKAHNSENPNITQKRESNFDIALAASENLSGFLVACALVMPDKKLGGVNVDSVIKKLQKKKDFAKAVRRDIIFDIEKTGLSLNEFVTISLDSMNEISSEIGV